MPGVSRGPDASRHPPAKSATTPATRAVRRVVLLVFMCLFSKEGTRPAGLTRQGRRLASVSGRCARRSFLLLLLDDRRREVRIGDQEPELAAAVLRVRQLARTFDEQLAFTLGRDLDTVLGDSHRHQVLLGGRGTLQ